MHSPKPYRANASANRRAPAVAPSRRFASGLGLALVAACASAHAQPAPTPAPPTPSAAAPGSDDSGDDDAALLRRSSNRANLRLGMASSDSNGRPVVCLEVRAVAALSLEGCGTGNGFLHDSPGASLTHFRGKWLLVQRVVSRGVLRAQLGAGLAELQIGSDRPGFVVAPDARDVEAAGPEGVLAVQWLRPMGGGWEFIVNTSAGLAWIPGADELDPGQGTLHPFVGFEMGAGW